MAVMVEEKPDPFILTAIKPLYSSQLHSKTMFLFSRTSIYNFGLFVKVKMIFSMQRET